MFNWLMNPIYNIISWVLLRWHWVWDAILPNGRFLGTNWDWVLAIVSLVVTVRIVLFPIFVKQIKSQRAMQALAPKIKELQAKHKGDRQTLQQEMMKLYQTEKVNPLMGCLPMLLQIPVFFGLFHTLKYINPLTVTSKTQYGWTAAQFDSAASARLFGAPIPGAFSSGVDTLARLGVHGPTVKIVAGVLVLLMMLTTFTTQRQMILKTGWQQEPQQKMIQRLMLYGIPVSLLVSGWAFPIGVVIYWVMQNLISLLQQQWVLRKYPPMITANTEAPKTAREREALANKKQPNALVRFFLVLPPPAKPAMATAGAGAQGGIGGVFARLRGRSTATTTTVAEPAPRALAPRPGAKPQRSVVSATAARPEPQDDLVDSIDDESEVQDIPAARPAKSAPVPAKAAKTAAPRTPAKAAVKAAPAKAPAAAKVAPAAKSAAAANGSKPAAVSVGRTPTVGTMPGSTPSAVGNGTNGASGNGARPAEAAPAKAAKAAPAKAAPRKGGQPGNKRSGKR
jgi:YidC/Oxa1 family membrane protein insertase